MTPMDKAIYIAQSLELGILFEVSANKPGNINLKQDFQETSYQHFLASAVASYPSFQKAAKKGLEASRGEITLEKMGIGRIIKECVQDIAYWQTGGNTLLGAILLMVPLASAAGMTPTPKKYDFTFTSLRDNLDSVVKSTTPQDAVDVYQAIHIANPSGLDAAPDFDVKDPNSIPRLKEEGVSLYDTFVIAAEYDSICAEWVNNYPLTFDVAYPSLNTQLDKDENLNKAVIHAFLEVLAQHPDTFIARKAGMEKAREVSAMADEVLMAGGLETGLGREKLKDFDRELRKRGNLLNPGTTADITATALGLKVLTGYRP